MERRNGGPITPLQGDEPLFSELADLIEAIGTKWLMEIIGYSKQSIGNYNTRLRGSKRLEKAIMINLKTALDLKRESQEKEYEKTSAAIEAFNQKIIEKTLSAAQPGAGKAIKKPLTRGRAALTAP